MLPRIILASSSPHRQAQLRQIGLEFSVVASQLDERPTQESGLPTAEIAQQLARAKGLEVARRHPEATVIAGDQMLQILDGSLTPVGKPGRLEAAGRQLAALAGKTHLLVTAAAVIHAGQIYEHTDITRMTMRPLSAEEIARYLAADLPFDCAGSYKWESRGCLLFQRVETNDPSAIVGLPMLWLTHTLRQLNYQLP